MSNRKKASPGYEVGYGRPPKQSRFQPGQSGNPGGRPKGAKGFNASVKRELEAKITVSEGGTQKVISKGEAVAKRLMEKALKGDMPAIRAIAEHDRSFAERLEVETRQAAAKALTEDIAPGEGDILQYFAAEARNGRWAPPGKREGE